METRTKATWIGGPPHRAGSGSGCGWIAIKVADIMWS